MNKNRSRIPKNCDRCGTPTRVFKMSRFNEEMVCQSCIMEEREAPGYAHASAVELDQLKARNYKFPGVGLDPLSLGFVCGRMALRGIGTEIISAYAKKHGYPYPENNLSDAPTEKEKGST